jgi:hypothetical protein
MRLSCGLSQKNWLVSQAIKRSGFMVKTELIVFLYSLLHDRVFGINLFVSYGNNELYKPPIREVEYNNVSTSM